MTASDYEPLLTPGEVAALFKVGPKSVTRWAKAGKLSCLFTPGGHRRFRESEVLALLEGVPEARPRTVRPDSDEMLRHLGLDGRRT